MPDRAGIKTDEFTRLIKLPYAIRIQEDECNGQTCYVAYHPELNGCMAQGDTPEEAVTELGSAREDYIGALLDQGIEVPLPVWPSQQVASESFAIEAGLRFRRAVNETSPQVVGSVRVAPRVFVSFDAEPSFSLGNFSIHAVDPTDKATENRTLTIA